MSNLSNGAKVNIGKENFRGGMVSTISWRSEELLSFLNSNLRIRTSERIKEVFVDGSGITVAFEFIEDSE
jgi:hypothetical protein